MKALAIAFLGLNFVACMPKKNDAVTTNWKFEEKPGATELPLSAVSKYYEDNRLVNKQVACLGIFNESIYYYLSQYSCKATIDPSKAIKLSFKIIPNTREAAPFVSDEKGWSQGSFAKYELFFEKEENNNVTLKKVGTVLYWNLVHVPRNSTYISPEILENGGVGGVPVNFFSEAQFCEDYKESNLGCYVDPYGEVPVLKFK